MRLALLRNETRSTTMTPMEKASRRRLGRGLIYAGVAVWVVYVVVAIGGGEPDGAKYLPFHLAGVIPGSIISRWDQIAKLWRRSEPSRVD